MLVLDLGFFPFFATIIAMWCTIHMYFYVYYCIMCIYKPSQSCQLPVCASPIFHSLILKNFGDVVKFYIPHLRMQVLCLKLQNKIAYPIVMYGPVFFCFTKNEQKTYSLCATKLSISTKFHNYVHVLCLVNSTWTIQEIYSYFHILARPSFWYILWSQWCNRSSTDHWLNVKMLMYTLNTRSPLPSSTRVLYLSS